MMNETLTKNEKKAIGGCKYSIISLNNETQYQLDREDTFLHKIAYEILQGRDKRQIFEQIEPNHDWIFKSFEESGSNNYYYECSRCDCTISKYDFNRLGLKQTTTQGKCSS